MAIQKTGNGSLVESAGQWVKDVGEKIKARVDEYKQYIVPIGYAKADKPTVEPNNALASIARAAARFVDKPGKEIPWGRVIMTNPYFGEHLYRPIDDDKTRALLLDAMKNPKFVEHLLELDRRKVNY